MPANIISFSGRTKSGKTMLAKLCEEHGYTIFNFADELKILVEQLLCISAQELERKKDLQQQIIISPEKLEQLLGFKPPRKTLFNSIRHLLQWLGTNVIRKYDPYWHICEIAKKITGRNKIVFADCRFQNELDFIHSLGGESWYIARPWCSNESIHPSEEDLDRIQFGNRVLLNLDDNTIIDEWKHYLETDQRPKVIDGLERTEFIRPKRKDAYGAGVLVAKGERKDNSMYIDVEANTLLYFRHKQRIEIPPILVDDLKRWRIRPPMYFNDWLTGMIDIQNDHNETENEKQICANGNLVRFILNAPIPRGTIYQEYDKWYITWTNVRRLRRALRAKHWKTRRYFLSCFK